MLILHVHGLQNLDDLFHLNLGKHYYLESKLTDVLFLKCYCSTKCFFTRVSLSRF